MYQYDDVFYRYITQDSKASARRVIPALLAALPHPIGSVLDVGCGAGAWLSIWKEHGARVQGLDGDYVDPGQLLIDPGEFSGIDLREAFDLGQHFDLVQSLEVAEHLPACSSAEFVASLCRHADAVLFSAATPGQGGENHINEQPYEYWRDLFRVNGFSMYDPVRPKIEGDTEVMDWYRYNTFLYIRDESQLSQARALRDTLVDDRCTPTEFAPKLYLARKGIIRLLPIRVSTALAIVKKKLFTLSLRLNSRE